jgi:hypothetical protein
MECCEHPMTCVGWWPIHTQQLLLHLTSIITSLPHFGKTLSLCVMHESAVYGYTSGHRVCYFSMGRTPGAGHSPTPGESLNREIYLEGKSW